MCNSKAYRPFSLLPLLLLLLLAGCGERETMYFTAVQGVYILEEDMTVRQVYAWKNHLYSGGCLRLVDGVPYVVDDGTVYRIGEDGGTSLMALDENGPSQAQFYRAYTSGYSTFEVTVDDGVVTAYYPVYETVGEYTYNPLLWKDGVMPELKWYQEQFGKPTTIVRAQSTDGTVRDYELPMELQSGTGFAVADGAIYTMQTLYDRHYDGRAALFRTDLETGQTQTVREERYQGEGELGAFRPYGQILGQTAFLIDGNEGKQTDTCRFFPLDGGEPWSCEVPTRQNLPRCEEGVWVVRAYQEPASLQRLDVHTGQRQTLVEMGEDNWAAYFQCRDAFRMAVYGRTAIFSVDEDGCERSYVYVVDLPRGEVTARWLV